MSKLYYASHTRDTWREKLVDTTTFDPQFFEFIFLYASVQYFHLFIKDG